MGNRNYEHGDQVEMRIILWYTPGTHLMQGRVVTTQWRGDDIVDSQVGKRDTLRNRTEAAIFSSLASDALWTRFQEDLFPETTGSSKVGDAPGPLVA